MDFEIQNGHTKQEWQNKDTICFCMPQQCVPSISFSKQLMYSNHESHKGRHHTWIASLNH